MGGTKTLSQEAPRLSSLQLQTATFGSPIPIVFGTTRISGNVIDYIDFTAYAHTSTQKTGGKGGKTAITSTTYTYTVAADVGLCEGQAVSVSIVSIGSIWASKEKTTLSNQGLTLLYNTTWGYMETYHSERALSYKNVYRVAGVLDLGSTGTLPNLTVEVAGLRRYSSTGIIDADPRWIVNDILTDPGFGAGFPSAYLDNWTEFSTYCIANGLFFSPGMNEQKTTSQWINEICQAANSQPVWSQGKLKLIPYGDAEITGNSVTYVPSLTPIYDISDDDYLDKDNPVKCTRSITADAYNVVKIQFLNRANDYNVEIAEAKDQANIEVYGVREMAPLNFNFIADQNTARKVAQLILQRTLYIRNRYTFRVGWKFCLLEPMDLITINDPGLGLVSQPVRVISITEDDHGSLTIEAEEFLGGIGSSPRYPTQDASRATVNYATSPGSVNAPIIFEPQATLTGSSSNEVWIAVSGAGAVWGGCFIYVSDDGLSYKQIGTVNGAARQGITTDLIPAVSNELDTSTVIKVDLTQSNGALLSGTQTDVDLYNTLCYVDGELFSYRDAVLTATDQYSLSYLRRGLYGIIKAQHAINSRFSRLDDAIFKYAFSADKVGKNIWLKFPSFNVWGGAVQSLDQVTAYQYAIAGSAFLYAIANVTGLTSYVTNEQTFLQWSPITDSRSFVYEVRKGNSLTNAVVVGTTSGNSFLTVGDGTYWVRAKYASVYSAIPATINVNGSTIAQNIYYSVNERETGWTGQLSGGAILATQPGQQTVVKLTGSGGVDGIQIVDEVAIWDNVDIYVASVGAYEIPGTHIVDLGDSQSGYILTDYTATIDSLQELFSQVPLVSALANVIGDFSRFGAVGIEYSLSTDGTNYTEWQPFTNGKYTFRKVKLRVNLYSYDTSITTILNDFNFTIGLPTRSFTGIVVTVPTSSLSVTFSPAFHITPNVQITILNQESGDTGYFSVTPSLTGFRYAVLNGGSPVERVINYTATAY